MSKTELNTPKISVLLVANESKERNVLQTALEMKGFRVRSFAPSSNGFLQLTQYRPEIVFMEMTNNLAEQAVLLKTAIRNAGKLGGPIVGYGNHDDEGVIRRMMLSGLKRYHIRPLKFGDLLKDMEQLLNYRNLKFLPNQITPNNKEEDFTFLLDPSKPSYEKLDTMKAYIDHLLSFPFIVAKVLEITNGDEKGAEDLAKVIEGDSSLLVTILKVANSAFFTTEADRKITYARDAVVRIGFNETKNICLTQKLLNLFDGEANEFGFDRVDFWVHSIACGLIAEKLSEKCGDKDPHKAFMAGLLHELGILLFDEFFDDIFERILVKNVEEGKGVQNAEIEVLGVTHNELVAKLFESWKMPPEIREAIKYHLDFHKKDVGVHPKAKKLATQIGLANLMAKSLNLGNSCDGFVHPVGDELLKSIGIQQPLENNFFTGIQQQIEDFAKFLGLDNVHLDDSDDIFSEQTNPVQTAVIDFAPSIFNTIFPYLEKSGHELHKMTIEEIVKKESEIELLVIYTDEQTTLSSVRNTLKPIKNSNGLVKIPTLVFWDEKGELENLREVGVLRKVPKTGDLRITEQTAQSVVGDDLDFGTAVRITEN